MSIKITLLGTGAAEGIPCFGCECPRCRAARENDDRNVRQRSCFLVQSEDQNILIDTPPDISRQLNLSNIHNLSAVFLSHEHYDHIGGLNEFEYWVNVVIHVFAGFGVLPQLQLSPRLQEKALLSPFTSHSPLYFGDIRVTPFRVSHTNNTYGFNIYDVKSQRQVVYFSDSSHNLGNYHLHLLKTTDVVILHTPRFEPRGPDDDHISVQGVVELVQHYDLGRVILTHINHHNLLYQELVDYLKPYPNIIVGYDRMVLEV